MFKIFVQMRKEIISEGDLLDRFHQYINRHNDTINSKATNLLKTLLKDIDY